MNKICNRVLRITMVNYVPHTQNKTKKKKNRHVEGNKKNCTKKMWWGKNGN